MNYKVVGSLGLIILSTLVSQAQGRFEVTPNFGYRWGGDLETSRGEILGLNDGRSYGICLDYSPNADDDIKLEVLWSRQESGVNLGQFGLGQVDVTVDEFMIGGLIQGRYGKLYGHLTGLMGATLFSPDDSESDARFSLSLGGGVKYYLFKNLALRADVRGYCNIIEGDGTFIYIGGITIAQFSGSTMWQGEVTGGLTLAF